MRKFLTATAIALFVAITSVHAAAAAHTQTLNVTIQGEFDVKPGSVCTYTADVTGGSGSYTYEWTLGSGSNIIGYGPSVNVQIPSGTHTSIYVQVWDGPNEDYDGRMIVMNAEGSECNT